MERRTESTKNCTDRENGSKESRRTQDKPRSRRDNETASIGDRERSENRDRRRPRGDRLDRRVVRSGEMVTERKKKSISRGGRKFGKKYTKEVNAGLSDLSKTILTRRVSRKQARAFSTQPTHKYKRNKNSKNVPAIPNRVFKALHILRHEKFLRVISRYLKPDN